MQPDINIDQYMKDKFQYMRIYINCATSKDNHKNMFSSKMAHDIEIFLFTTFRTLFHAQFLKVSNQ